MKKKPVRTFLLFAAFMLFVCLLSSCEMGSLLDDWRQTTAATVFLPSGGTPTTASPSTSTASPHVSTASPPAMTVTTSATVTTAAVLHENPLTGLPVLSGDATARPLAFCVKSAGSDLIAAADIVIEAPTEAAHTRLSLLAVSRTELFPALKISSTRAHLAALTHDFFGISIYNGTSDNGHASLDFLYDSLDLSEIECEPTVDALRAALADAGIQAVSTGKILLPYGLAPQGTQASPEGTASSYVSVAFTEDAVTSFTYDALTHLYTMREASGMTGGNTAPTFSNLLLLFHDATRRITKDGVELTLDTQLGGHGYYLSQGRGIPIFWRRDPVTSSLSFTDTDGNPITANRGKTYVGMTTYEYRDRLILN